MHGIEAREIELSEPTKEIRQKDTAEILVSWKETES